MDTPSGRSPRLALDAYECQSYPAAGAAARPDASMSHQLSIGSTPRSAPSGRCAVVFVLMGRLHAPLPSGRCAVVFVLMGRLHAPLPSGRCAVVFVLMGRLHAPLPSGRCAVVSCLGQNDGAWLPSRSSHPW